MGKIVNQRLLFIIVDQVLNNKEAIAMCVAIIRYDDKITTIQKT